MSSVVYIPNTQYGIVERKWSFTRSEETFGLISLKRNAGFVPEVKRGGWHLLFPYQYRVIKKPLIRIDQIAYIVARVGQSLGEGQALAKWPDGITVEDARGFLMNGGQRGFQRRIERAGTYAINTALFCVITDGAILNIEGGGSSDDTDLQRLLRDRRGFNPIVIGDDNIGIVTVQDGPALQHGEIIAPTVGTDSTDATTFHNSFTDIPKFLAAGGRRGRQEQVLVEGTYYLNRLFATVEIKEKTKIGIGTVGVINSYVGPDVVDATTADRGRGRTVDRGQRGIWSRPYEPGKYPINPYAMEVVIVPTTNFQLRWMEDVTSSAIDKGSMSVSYDDDLKEIPVITKDAFDIRLPVSIVAHIAPANAPHLIQRFSQVQRLVNQTLDPFISSYFRDAAQGKTLLEFIQHRSEIGAEALAQMRTRLSEHKIDIEEVMLGTPRAPKGDDKVDQLLDQLRQRQIANEQTETFKSQGSAAAEQTKLNEAVAIAGQQAALTASKIAITVAENEGAAQTARSKQAADGIKAMAEAEAFAAKAKSDAIGGREFLLQQLAVTELARAIKETPFKLVPDVVVTSGENSSSSVVDALMALALKDVRKIGGLSIE